MDNLQVGLGTKEDSLREELSTKMDKLQIGFDSLQAGVASESFGKFKHEITPEIRLLFLFERFE